MLVDLSHNPLPLHFPWLMLPDHHRHHHHHHHRAHDGTEVYENQQLKCFFSLYTNQTHCLELPEAFEKTVCGSSSGWLILRDETTSSVILLNPLNRAQIALPELSSSPFYDQDPSRVLHKAVLSSDPSRCPFDYKVLAVFGEKRRLICYKARDKTWTILHDAGNNYEDIILFNGEELLAATDIGKLVSCDLDDDGWFSLSVNEIAPPFTFKGGKVYLVGIGGELVMLIRFVQDNPRYGHETYDFEAYRYEQFESEWEAINGLGEWTIFVGKNHTTAIKAQDFKGLIKPNCIYFTDDSLDMEDSLMVGHDSGIFSMEEGKFEALGCDLSGFMYVWPRPVWFMPNMA
ncbi:hypothetical protein TB2_039045 [Malus domestica]|nr:F-box protein SKIP23-like [Malus domestica]